MAVTRNMGQKRWSSAEIYTEITGVEIKPLIVKEYDEEDIQYSDVAFSLTGNTPFQKNIPYYVELSIPYHPNFPQNFIVRLLVLKTSEKANNSVVTTLADYQTLKYLELEKAKKTDLKDYIILYPCGEDGKTYAKNGDSACVQRAWELNEGSVPTDMAKGDILYSDGYYFQWNSDTPPTSDSLPSEGGNWTEIKNKMSGLWEYVWKIDSEATSSKTFKFIFTPQTEDSFNTIWLQMVRSSVDNDIYGEQKIYPGKDDKNFVYGRQVYSYKETDKDGNVTAIIIPQIKIYKLKNLIIDDYKPTEGKVWDHIGIYAHPELSFAINGEEIKTGPSEFYELKDFDINYLGVAAINGDRYTIDWQSRTLEENE